MEVAGMVAVVVDNKWTDCVIGYTTLVFLTLVVKWKLAQK
jgi:hypothetical protein